MIACVTGLAMASTASAGCLDFYRQVTLGPYAGSVYQLDANTQLIIKPMAFWGPPGAPTPHFNVIKATKSDCFGGPVSLQLNNVGLAIYIVQREPNAKVVTFNYRDMGGYENVGADYGAPPSYIGEIAHAPHLPDPFGGTVRVYANEVPFPGGKEGMLIYGAKKKLVTYMEIGGQEFLGHSICVN